MSHGTMTQDQKERMHRYIKYRCEDEGIVLMPDSIGLWISEHILELGDTEEIDAYLLEKEG